MADPHGRDRLAARRHRRCPARRVRHAHRRGFRDASWTYLTFTPPDGDTLTIDIEAYVRALHRTDAAGTVAAVTPDGTLVAPVNIRTCLIP